MPRSKLSRTLNVLVVVVLLGLLVLGNLGAGCSPAPAQQPQQKKEVTIAMGFIPNVQFAPFYVAQDKGYFEEEGLEVTFNYGFDTDLIKLLAADELQFVVGSGDQVILARSQGLPVVYVLQWWRQFPVSIVSLAENGIEKPDDLVGKVVGTPVMFGASYIGWKALVYAAGVPEEDVSLQAIGYTQVASLLEGRVDAAVCYVTNEPIQLRSAGHEINEILVSDYIDLISNGLLTNEKSIGEREETVAALVRAVIRGIEDAVADPDGAFEICLKFVPEAGGENRDAQQAVLNRSVELWKAERTGWSDHDAWEASHEFMLTMGLIDQQTDVQELYNNQFIPDAK